MTPNMGCVDYLNSVAVTKDELMSVSEGTGELKETDEPFEATMFMLGRRYKGQPQKASAVLFRMQALVRFVESDQAKGWTLPKQSDGGIPTMDAVFAAAAIHPLSVVGDQVGFEAESFCARVLELAESEGRA